MRWRLRMGAPAPSRDAARRLLPVRAMITARRGIVVAVGQVWRTRRGARRRVESISDDEQAILTVPHCTVGRHRYVRPAWFANSAILEDENGNVHRETINRDACTQEGDPAVVTAPVAADVDDLGGGERPREGSEGEVEHGQDSQRQGGAAAPARAAAPTQAAANGAAGSRPAAAGADTRAESSDATAPPAVMDGEVGDGETRRAG